VTVVVGGLTGSPAVMAEVRPGVRLGSQK